MCSPAMEHSVTTPVFVWRASVMRLSERRLRIPCVYCQNSLTEVSFSLDTMESRIGQPLHDAYWRLISEAFPEFKAGVRSYSDLRKIAEDDPNSYGGADEVLLYYWPYMDACGRCGWWRHWINQGNVGRTSEAVGALLEFEINDSRLLISELKSHLAKRFSDIYTISSHRFEEVIASVYRSLGWTVSLTTQTRDGGVDLFCLEKNTGDLCIVECKRYAADRKVGIAFVDRLIGTSFRIGADEAHLVTSSDFSRPAVDAADQATNEGLRLKLVDAHELLRLLRVYSDDSLTPRDIRKIFGDATQ